MNYPAASYGVSEGVFALQTSDLQTSGLSEASFGESDPQRLSWCPPRQERPLGIGETAGGRPPGGL